MSYFGRPGLSPVTAALVQTGALPRGARILEVGTGNGTEAIALARLGYEVVATDVESVEDAERAARRAGVAGAMRFVVADALALGDAFPPASFDAVVDVLAYNNVAFAEDAQPGDAERYVRQVWKVLRPKGVWAVQWRAERALAREADVHDDLPKRTWKLFEGEPPIWTHLPEYKSSRRRSGFAPIGFAFLTKRG